MRTSALPSTAVAAVESPAHREARLVARAEGLARRLGDEGDGDAARTLDELLDLCQRRGEALDRTRSAFEALHARLHPTQPTRVTAAGAFT